MNLLFRWLSAQRQCIYEESLFIRYKSTRPAQHMSEDVWEPYRHTLYRHRSFFKYSENTLGPLFTNQCSNIMMFNVYIGLKYTYIYIRILLQSQYKHYLISFNYAVCYIYICIDKLQTFSEMELIYTNKCIATIILYLQMSQRPCN